MNDTQISAKHWEKAMLHANWDMEDEMKISNAIRNVESIFSNSPDIVSDEAIESVEIALEAMQKQDPMKPTYDLSDWLPSAFLSYRELTGGGGE